MSSVTCLAGLVRRGSLALCLVAVWAFTSRAAHAAEVPTFVCDGKTHRGDLRVTTSEGLAALNGVECFDGDLILGKEQCSDGGDSVRIADLAPLHSLRVVTGVIRLNGLFGVGDGSDLSSLEYAGLVDLSCAAPRLALPALRSASIVTSHATDIALPKLEYSGSIIIDAYEGKVLRLPSLRVGNLNIARAKQLEEIDAPRLERIGALQMNDVRPLSTVRLPSLEAIGVAELQFVGERTGGADLSFLAQVVTADGLLFYGVHARAIDLSALRLVDSLKISGAYQTEEVMLPALLRAGEVVITETRATSVRLPELSSAASLRIDGNELVTTSVPQLRTLTGRMMLASGESEARGRVLAASVESPSNSRAPDPPRAQDASLALTDLGGGCRVAEPLPRCPDGTVTVRPGPPADEVLECATRAGWREGPYARFWTTSCEGSPVPGMLVMREQAAFRDGALEGRWATWRRDGSPRDALRFSGGVPQGKRVQYDNTGAIGRERNYARGEALPEIMERRALPTVTRPKPVPATPASKPTRSSADDAGDAGDARGAAPTAAPRARCGCAVSGATDGDAIACVACIGFAAFIVCLRARRPKTWS